MCRWYRAGFLPLSGLIQSLITICSNLFYKLFNRVHTNTLISDRSLCSSMFSLATLTREKKILPRQSSPSRSKHNSRLTRLEEDAVSDGMMICLISIQSSRTWQKSKEKEAVYLLFPSSEAQIKSPPLHYLNASPNNLVTLPASQSISSLYSFKIGTPRKYYYSLLFHIIIIVRSCYLRCEYHKRLF